MDIENITHWKTSDIKRLVQAAEVASNTVGRYKKVRVNYLISTSLGFYANALTKTLSIRLPKRGTNQPHPNPLVALASAGIESGTPILAVQTTYQLANYLAEQMSICAHGALGDTVLHDHIASDMPPSWAPGLVIRKYADPLKDGTFLDFCKKKEREIEKAQKHLDKWQPELDRAKKEVTKAKILVKKLKRSLANAKARRRT